MTIKYISKTPKHEHDSCPECIYLETYHDKDIYYCGQGFRAPTIIVRYGSEPQEYDSGFMGDSPETVRGRTLSWAMGLWQVD